MKKLITASFFFLISNLVFGQKTVEELEKEINILKDSLSNSTKLVDAITTLNRRLNRDFDGDKKERVQLGLSFAYGEISEDERKRYKSPTINPNDSTLRFQQLDGRFILISTTMTVTPLLYADWVTEARKNISNSKKREKIGKAAIWALENSGFSININFLEIATGSSQQPFNQIVEGGIGYSIRLNKNIYWSLTRELKFFKALNTSFVEGETIFLNGNKIASINELSTNDQNYYYNSSLLHWSWRIIVNF